MIYKLARKLYQKLSNLNESRLGLCTEGLCCFIQNDNWTINGNSHQHTPKRFYPQYIGHKEFEKTLKKNSSQHHKILAQNVVKRKESSRNIQRLQLTRKLKF